jgi:hypothetical protein
MSIVGAYSREREYVGDHGVGSEYGWRLGRTGGVSVRFGETVLSLTEVSRERGMPNKSRFILAAGMSW